jgi:hypothetical protein
MSSNKASPANAKRISQSFQLNGVAILGVMDICGGKTFVID